MSPPLFLRLLRCAKLRNIFLQFFLLLAYKAPSVNIYGILHYTQHLEQQVLYESHAVHLLILVSADEVIHQEQFQACDVRILIR